VRGDRSVDVFVRKLRQKLEKASPEWRYIHTHFGIGYRFAAEPADGAAGGHVDDSIVAAQSEAAASEHEQPQVHEHRPDKVEALA